MANPSYYVVCLHRNCNDEAATFISNALTQTLAKGGAELIVRQVGRITGNVQSTCVDGKPKILF